MATPSDEMNTKLTWRRFEDGENKWDDYTKAKEAMFFHTDTADAPWAVVKSDDKKRARINCLRHFLYSLDYPSKDPTIAHRPDPRILGTVDSLYPKKMAKYV